MPLNSSDEEISTNNNTNDNDLTTEKIAELMGCLEKIYSSPHYLRLLKGPDNMTYESMVSSLVNFEIDQKEKEKEKEIKFK